MSGHTVTPLRAATRASNLARAQVDIVARLIGRPVEPVVVSTVGDRRAHEPISAIGGRGAFVGDVRDALAAGAADIAVHSAKDLPPRDDPRFELWFPRRGDPRDVLVGSTWQQLRRGAVVATGAPRRRAQIIALRPDVELAELRGNIETRLRRGERYDAIVMAAIAIERLGLRVTRPTQALEPSSFVPAVGQGAIAVETRAGDQRTRSVVAHLDDPSTRVALTAERAFLAALGGDCDLPAGAHATVDRSGAVMLNAMLADGFGEPRRTTVVAGDPAVAGARAAEGLQALSSVGPTDRSGRSS